MLYDDVLLGDGRSGANVARSGWTIREDSLAVVVVDSWEDTVGGSWVVVAREERVKM